MRLPALKFLRTFQVAANRLSFRLAAEELFVTPSAVSHQIKALEEQLGVVLFERGPRSLTLTEAGRSYLQHVETIFARLERVTEQLQIRHGRSVVRLRTPPFFATELLLPRLLGHVRAAEKLLLGDPFGPQDAVDLGLANAVLPASEVVHHARRVAERFSGLPPGAVRDSKRLMRRATAGQVTDAIAAESGLFLERLSSPEAREAFGAFLQKRKPDFSQFS